MLLREAISQLDALPDDATIYVEGTPASWSSESDAAVGIENVEAEVETLPPEAEGRTYFLEVAIVKKVLSGWARNLDRVPTFEESLERVIHYARYDA